MLLAIKSPKLYSFKRKQTVTLKMDSSKEEKQYAAGKQRVQTHSHVALLLPTQSPLVPLKLLTWSDLPCGQPWKPCSFCSCCPIGLCQKGFVESQMRPNLRPCLYLLHLCASAHPSLSLQEVSALGGYWVMFTCTGQSE